MSAAVHDHERAPAAEHHANHGLVPPGRRCACGGIAGPAGMCAECASRALALRRSPAGPAPAAVPPLAGAVLREPGARLEAGVRSVMERHLGQSLSRVRVHADVRAGEAARSVGAHAYTVGEHIVFGAGRYAPATGPGASLLAHELAHVRQQRDPAPAPASADDLVLGDPRAPEEAEADAVARSGAGAVARHPMAGRVLQRQVATAPADQGAAVRAVLDRHMEEDIGRIVAKLDEFHYDDADEQEVIRLLRRWAGKRGDGLPQAGQDNRLERIFSRLTGRTTRRGVFGETTNYYSLIFNHFDRRAEVRALRDEYAPAFRGDEGLAELDVVEEASKWKETAGAFWTAQSKRFGAYLRDQGTPAIIQNLFGGVAGVAQGFAEILIELVEGVLSLAQATWYADGALKYVLAGAAQELGLGFLQKLPFVGWAFDPEQYRERYESTAEFLEGARKALSDPGMLLRGLRRVAVEAWEKAMAEYHQADEFNKSRIIAAGVVKVGMAIGGFIKELPQTIKTVASIGKTIARLAVKFTRTIAKALRGGLRLAGKILRGAWEVVEETLEGGGRRLRYFFRRDGAHALEEVAEHDALPFVRCNTCEITPEGTQLLETSPKPPDAPPAPEPVKKPKVSDAPRQTAAAPFDPKLRRPLLPRTKAARRLAVTRTGEAGARVRVFKLEVPKAHQAEHAEIMKILAKKNATAEELADAGQRYERLMAKADDTEGVRHFVTHTDVDKPRKPDRGFMYEDTIEGRAKGFGSEKLDQLWRDLIINDGSATLTVPKLSPNAEDQLALLAAQFEDITGRKIVLLLIRETGP